MLPYPPPAGDGWIYICVDFARLRMCKIGQTGKLLDSRARPQTSNSGYLFVVGFKVPAEEARDIEQYLYRKIPYSRDAHRSSRNHTLSEWFHCTPAQAVNALQHHLANCLPGHVGEDGEYLLGDITCIGELTVSSLARLWGSNCTDDEVYFYFDSVNDVRLELGLPAVAWHDLFPLAPPRPPRGYW